jgi:hypothetical protein
LRQDFCNGAAGTHRPAGIHRRIVQGTSRDPFAPSIGYHFGIAPAWLTGINLSEFELIMMTDGQRFLEELSRCPAESFERKFLDNAATLGLGEELTGDELCRLLGAALLATACNSTFNDPHAIGPAAASYHETRRTNLEKSFMDARAYFYGSVGWQGMALCRQQAVRKSFLRVEVCADNLAW